MSVVIASAGEDGAFRAAPGRHRTIRDTPGAWAGDGTMGMVYREKRWLMVRATDRHDPEKRLARRMDNNRPIDLSDHEWEHFIPSRHEDD